MTRACTAIALLLVVTLLPHFAEAGGNGSDGNGYVDTPLGPIPMNLMVQAGGCPYTASEMYQQQMMYQQQQSMRQMQQAGKSSDGDSQLGSAPGTSGSTSNRVASSDIRGISKKKKRTTMTTKKARAQSTATETARSKTPEMGG